MHVRSSGVLVAAVGLASSLGRGRQQPRCHPLLCQCWEWVTVLGALCAAGMLWVRGVRGPGRCCRISPSPPGGGRRHRPPRWGRAGGGPVAVPIPNPVPTPTGRGGRGWLSLPGCVALVQARPGGGGGSAAVSAAGAGLGWAEPPQRIPAAQPPRPRAGGARRGVPAGWVCAAPRPALHLHRGHPGPALGHPDHLPPLLRGRPPALQVGKG